MTTFDAVAAHWPRPARHRSTQKSRRSRKTGKASSVNNPSPPAAAMSSSQQFSRSDGYSSPKREDTPLLDIKPDISDLEPFNLEDTHMNGDTSSSEEEDNPFEAFAMSQASQGIDVKVKVNSRLIQRHVPAEDEVDDEELEQQRHAADARHHAEEGQKYRATQTSKQDADDTDEYGDDELDELFQRTVAGGWKSSNTTPTRRGANEAFTPSTSASTPEGSVGWRRSMRDQRLREEAGLGDLRSVHHITST